MFPPQFSVNITKTHTHTHTCTNTNTQSLPFLRLYKNKRSENLLPEKVRNAGQNVANIPLNA